MSVDPVVEQDNRTIYIRVTIDTVLVFRDSRGSGNDAATATTIDRHHGTAIVTAAARAANQGTADLAFDAGEGDDVRFFATSGSNNFDQSVLIQDIRHAGGDEILQGFQSLKLERTGIVPGTGTNVLAVEPVQRQFWCSQCKVAREGTGTYLVVLALYAPNEQGQPQFAGYYQWEPQITIHFISPSIATNTQSQEKPS